VQTQSLAPLQIGLVNMWRNVDRGVAGPARVHPMATCGGATARQVCDGDIRRAQRVPVQAGFGGYLNGLRYPGH
jgi:hypothetical protein